MVPLTDPDTLAKFNHALGQWRFTGYITWEAIARRWVEDNLEGWTTRAVAEEMWRHFETGGRIDEIRETRPEWTEYRYHYDFRIQFADRLVYVETLLIEDEPNDPTIHVVSIHDA
ncbi:MAG: hypothetical protein GXX96_34320 [Planctomycetaceae bacterium]|nr:hypothetical protein [Planctomycetaceae bacterium]